MKYLLVLLLLIIPVSAYAYNSGFTPIYQPNTGGSSSVGSIHNIGNVTETGCAENEILKVNSTGFFACDADDTGAAGESNTASSSGVGYSLVLPKVGVDLPFRGIFCAGDILCSSNSTDVRISYTATAMGSSALDDLTDVIITSPAALSTLFYDGVNWIDKIFSINSITCGAGQFVNSINNQTGATACGSPTGSGFTTVASSPQTTATILASNSSNTAVIKTLTQGQGITLTNGSQAVTIATNFKSNTLTCGSTDKFSAYDNSTGLFTCSADQTGSGGGPTVLGADVTCTATASYCTVFTIPLTASSGNAIEIKLIADSNTAGAAVQPRVIFDNAGNTGYCNFRVYTTATAEVLDNLAITTSTADTGETVWLAAANTPMPLDISCGLEGDATPGNAVVQIQMEVASTGTVQKGSFYIKTP